MVCMCVKRDAKEAESRAGRGERCRPRIRLRGDSVWMAVVPDAQHLCSLPSPSQSLQPPSNDHCPPPRPSQPPPELPDLAAAHSLSRNLHKCVGAVHATLAPRGVHMMRRASTAFAAARQPASARPGGAVSHAPWAGRVLGNAPTPAPLLTAAPPLPARPPPAAGTDLLPRALCSEPARQPGLGPGGAQQEAAHRSSGAKGVQRQRRHPCG